MPADAEEPTRERVAAQVITMMIENGAATRIDIVCSADSPPVRLPAWAPAQSSTAFQSKRIVSVPNSIRVDAA